jgi:hypothetical protein
VLLEPVCACAIGSVEGVVVAGCSALDVTVCAMAAPIMPAVATVEAAVTQNFFAFILFTPERLKINESANADEPP